MNIQKTLQGRSVFIKDIRDKTALSIRIKRSRISRGKIRGMIFPELPPDVTIIRAKDIPGKNSISIFGARIPVLSTGEIQYKGEPVLLLAGPDERVLEDLSDQIVIDYEEQAPRYDFKDLKPEDICYTRLVERGDGRGDGGSPSSPLPSSSPTSTSTSSSSPSSPSPPLSSEEEKAASPPLSSETNQRENPGGNPGDKSEAANQAGHEAARTVMREYTTGLQEHYYAQPHGAYVRWIGNTSSLQIFTSSRWPAHVHTSLCEVLALPRELVSVTIPDAPERSLYGKVWYSSLIAVYGALAAWLTRRNIKILFSQEEDFCYSPKRTPALLRYQVRQDADGNLASADVRIFLNFGAYPVFARQTVDRAAFAALGAYHCPRVRVEVLAVKTNLPPLGPFIGMGNAISLFAAETLTESLCHAAGKSPLDWKKANIFCKTKASLSGILPRDSLPPPELLDMAARMSDFNRKHAAFELIRKRRQGANRLQDCRRGIGIAIGCQGAGFFLAEEEKLKVSLELSMDTEGKVTISQPTLAGSGSLLEIWKKTVSQSLGTPVKDIHIAPLNTESGRDGGPAILSRGITITTKLIEDCCELLKKKRFRSPLPLTVSKTCRPPSPASWEDETFTGNPFIEISWAAAVVELRMDPLTLNPEIEGIWMAVDGGKILSRTEARRNIESSINDAIGWTAFEHINFINGEIPRGQFSAYRIPTCCDVPAPQIEFLADTAKTPVKGIGELPHTCVPAAYINALGQASGFS
ncbi:MAG: molybdopterin-dependent oxidoreductase, partial [Spirochaetales bacterium]|nr:molybdopterin-dependent oxidoreductase [Spirochaetales bacterium]